MQGSLYRNFEVNKYDVLVAKDYLMSTQYTVGIDIDLINFKLLSPQEKKYPINYHFEVYSKIHKFLSLNEKKWLIKSI